MTGEICCLTVQTKIECAPITAGVKKRQLVSDETARRSESVQPAELNWLQCGLLAAAAASATEPF